MTICTLIFKVKTARSEEASRRKLPSAVHRVNGNAIANYFRINMPIKR